MPVWRVWARFGEKDPVLDGGTMEEYGVSGRWKSVPLSTDGIESLPHSMMDDRRQRTRSGGRRHGRTVGFQAAGPAAIRRAVESKRFLYRRTKKMIEGRRGRSPSGLR